ncbi:MAG: tyrosine-type recombinase/integrase [Ferruginibacter sp.]
MNDLIKKIPKVKWSQTYKCWYLPLSKSSFEAITTAVGNNATIASDNLKAYLQKRTAVAATLALPVKNSKPVKIPLPQAPVYKLGKENLQALELFMQQLALKAYSSSTIRTYRNEFLQLLQLLKTKPVNNLTVADIKRYMVYAMEKEGISENTAHSRLNALKFYFEQVLAREKFFWEIPRPKKANKLPKVISEEKILEGLLSIKNNKHKTLLLLAYSAGLRVSEVIQLKVTDINSDRMQININAAKGKKDRVATLSSSILIMLRVYYKEYKPKEWLFEGQNKGEHYSSRSAQLVFKAAFKTLGLPNTCSFHSLRHSYATHLLENGTDITYIQKLLGHNDIKTTLRYTHVSNKTISKIESPLDKIMRKKGL